jgi:hypothetical protein
LRGGMTSKTITLGDPDLLSDQLNSPLALLA